MKILFKTFLKYYLKLITKAILSFHNPKIIVVAGSTNKHFVKQAIKSVLVKKGYTTRANPKNFNTEIGLPLAVLNLSSGYNSYKHWLPIMFTAIKRLIQFDFPEFLVLSLGSSDPGDMKYLLSIVRPDIAIITDITQRYREGFSDVEELLNEYKYLVNSLGQDAMLILNQDNHRLSLLKSECISRVISFGFSLHADYNIDIKKIDNTGQEIKIINDISREYKINRFGKHHAVSKAISLIVSDNIK